MTFDAQEGQPEKYRRRHSLSGALACIMAAMALLLWIVGAMAHRYGDGGAALIVLVIAWSGMASLCLIGLGLAIQGVIPRRRKKLLPAIGLLANPLILALFLIYFSWPTSDTLVAAVVHDDLATIDRALKLGVDMQAPSTLDAGEIHAGATALTAAAQLGKRELVAELLSRGADIHQPDTHGATPLHHAVAASHAFVVQDLLDHHADVNQPGPDGYPLQLAARQGHQAILESLLAHGAHVNPPGRSPLHEAAALGHLGITKRLLEAGAQVTHVDEKDHTALHLAAAQGHIHVLKLLLAHQADPNARDAQGVTPLELALEAGHQDVARTLMDAGATTDLFIAILMNDPERIESILQRDPQAVDARRQGQTPLHKAVLLNRQDIALLLLRHHAHVNAVTDDDRHLTPLHLAVLHGHEPLARLLIDHEADIHQVMRHDGSIAPPLFYAIQRDDVAMAELLLTHGADVNALCETAELAARPIHFAVLRNAPRMVLTLLDHKADIDGRKNGNSPTPLYEAVKLGYVELVDLLLKRGADPTLTVGQMTPITLAEASRNRDPMVYDAILKMLQHAAGE